MFHTAKSVLLIAGLHSAIALLHADAIQVNGTCELNTCAATETLAPSASSQDSFNFIYTFTNSDRYQAIGAIGAYNNSDSTGFVGIKAADITLTFLGNTSGTISNADTLTIDFLQYFQTSPWRSFVNHSGYEYVSGVFGGPIANASSVSARSFSSRGTAMALLGPFSPRIPSRIPERTSRLAEDL